MQSGLAAELLRTLFSGMAGRTHPTAGMEMSRMPHAKFHESLYVPMLWNELDEEGGNYTDGAYDEEKPKPN